MAGAYTGFLQHEAGFEVLLLPSTRDACPLQGYPEQYVTGTQLYTLVKRDKVEYSSLSNQETTRLARLESWTQFELLTSQHHMPPRGYWEGLIKNYFSQFL